MPESVSTFSPEITPPLEHVKLTMRTFNVEYKLDIVKKAFALLDQAGTESHS